MQPVFAPSPYAPPLPPAGAESDALTPSPPPGEWFGAVIDRTLARSSAKADAPEHEEEKPRSKSESKKTGSRDPLLAGADNSAAQLQAAGAGADNAATTPASPAPDSSQNKTEAAAGISGSTASSAEGDPSGATTPNSEGNSTPAQAGGAGNPKNLELPDGLRPIEASEARSSPAPAPAPALPEGKTDPVPPAETASNQPSEGKTALQRIPPPPASGTMESAGISSAQHQVPMQKADKMKDFAAGAEQNLPAQPAVRAGEVLPPKGTRTVHLAAADREKADFAQAPSGVAAPASTETASTPAEAWPSTSPARSLERTHDLMSLHAFRLRDTGADSLQVVIKPGPGIQLSLELQMRGNAVEMRATLHRGDFEFLSKHWSELQQQLEPRGVRLAPLAASGQPATGGNNNASPHSDRRQSHEESTRTGAFAEFALAGAVKPATKTKLSRGWESWA